MTQAPPTIPAFNVVSPARYGTMLYNRHDAYVGRSFELYGEFSEGEVELFRHFLVPGMIALDIGANIGAHTVPMAQLVGPAGAVFAFEPQRIPYQALCANVALNSLVNVYPLQKAVGDPPEGATLIVPVLDPCADQNFGGLSLLAGHERGERVALIAIDSLHLPRVEFMKVDVEGMEPEVLKGARKTLQQFMPTLYLESDRQDRRAELGELLDELGYDCWWHTPPLYNPDNFEGNAENVFVTETGQSVVSINLLCLHRSHDFPPPNLPPARLT